MPSLSDPAFGHRVPAARPMKLSPKRKHLIAAAAGLAVGVLAALAGKWLGKNRPQETSAPISPASRTAAPGDEPGGLADLWAARLRKNGWSLSGRLDLAELAARAGSGDLPRLLSLAEGNDAARDLLLRHWARTDPRAAAAWLASTGKMKELDSIIGGGEVQTVYSVWARNDPAAAMAGLKAHSDLNRRRLWTTSILESLLDEDMAAGVKFGVLSGSGMSLSKSNFRSASPDWVKKDPARAAALLAAEVPGEFRNAYLGEAIDALAGTDLPAAIGLLRRHQGGGAEWIPEELFGQWARQDAASLSAWLEGEAPPWQKSAIRTALARHMAETDPVAALRWSSEHLDGGNRDQVQSGVLTRLARSDPAAALAWLDSLSEGTALRGAVDHFANALPDSSPESLLAAAGSLPQGAARGLLTATAYEKWFQRDPDHLLANLAAQPAESLPEGIWARLGKSTAGTEEGLRHAATLPPEVMPDYLKAVFQHHIQWHHMPQFTKVLAGMTDPAMRAAAIEGAMGNLAWLDPAPVTVWARSLPEAERRLVAGELTRRLPDLTAQQKKELIDPLK